MREEMREETAAFYCVEHPLMDSQCAGCDGDVRLIHIGRDEHLVCDPCRLVCYVGSKLLSSWREQTEEHWRRNAESVAGFAEVRIYGPRSPDAPPHVRRLANRAAWRQKLLNDRGN